jgi:hypothetical protein
MAQIVADCERFQRENAADISEDNLAIDSRCSAIARAGHDFWLTRNGHGAGFWDGDWREPSASRLTAAAHKFGECNIDVYRRKLHFVRC